MPVWLLKFLLSFVISLLTKKLGSLATVKHVEGQLEKHAPLEADPLPPLSQENNPNMRNHYGGL